MTGSVNALFVRLLASTVALWIAVRLVPGLVWQGTATGLLGVALVLGIISTFARPEIVEMDLSTPLVTATLGGVILVVNTMLLWLTGEVAGVLGLTFHVTGFRAAFLGALIVTAVSTPLEMLVRRRSVSRRGTTPDKDAVDDPHRAHLDEDGRS